MRQEINATQAEHCWIDGNQAEEVRQTCRDLHTTPERLSEAIRAVGYDGLKIERYLAGDIATTH